MLLAILDFARIASALVVVVGVTSHLGSGAALSPRRRRIVGAHNRTEMLRSYLPPRSPSPPPRVPASSSLLPSCALRCRPLFSPVSLPGPLAPPPRRWWWRPARPASFLPPSIVDPPWALGSFASHLVRPCAAIAHRHRRRQPPTPPLGRLLNSVLHRDSSRRALESKFSAV